MNKPLSMEEFKALGVLAKARRELLVNMFGGTKLRFGSKTIKETKDDIKEATDLIKTSVKGGAKGTKAAVTTTGPAIRKAVEEFIRNCADVENIQDVVEAIGGAAVQEIIGEITPYVGVVVSAGKLGMASKKVVETGRGLYKHSYYRDGFRPGDPQAAAQSIKIILERDLARHSIDAAREAAACGTKIAGLFADFGTASTAAIGFANVLASLGLKLYALGLDIKDWRAGNAILAQPQTLSLDCFNKCPVLGCYLITCADTSSVANLFVADIGLPGWMDKVEELKKKQMDPLIKIAKEEIKRSPLQLEGLRSDKGTHPEPDFFSKIKSKMVSKISSALKRG